MSPRLETRVKILEFAVVMLTAGFLTDTALLIVAVRL